MVNTDYTPDEATCIYNLQQLMAHSKPGSFVSRLIADYVPNAKYCHTDVTTINYTGGTAQMELKTRDLRNVHLIEDSGIFVEVDKVKHGTQIYVNFINNWQYVTIHFLPCLPIDTLPVYNVTCYNSNRTEPKYILPLKWGYILKWDGERYRMTKPSEVFPCDKLNPTDYDPDAWAEVRKERLTALKKYNDKIIVN